MAYTIQEIQSSIAARALDTRQLINIIVDYLQANPGGGGDAAGYLVYTALLTQSGTDDPVPTVLENTLGGTVVWSRNGEGDYVGTLAGAFTVNKTWSIIQNNVGAVVDYVIFNQDVNVVFLGTNSNDLPADDKLFGTCVEIRVYS